MPIAAILIGAIMIGLAFRGTEHEFATLAARDFGGGSQFFAWGGAIVVIGSLGYVKGLERVSTLLLALVVVVLALRHGGGFDALAQAIIHPPTPAAAVALPAEPPPAAPAKSSSSGGDSTTSDILSTVGEIAAFAILAA